MSTKAIRELVERTVKQGGTIGKDALAALAEVDAIERAAKAFHEDLDPRVMSHAPKSLHEALDTLTDIAKDAS